MAGWSAASLTKPSLYDRDGEKETENCSQLLLISQELRRVLTLSKGDGQSSSPTLSSVMGFSPHSAFLLSALAVAWPICHHDPERKVKQTGLERSRETPEMPARGQGAQNEARQRMSTSSGNISPS